MPVSLNEKSLNTTDDRLETDVRNAVLLIFNYHFFAASAEHQIPNDSFILLISHVWKPYWKSVSKNDGSLHLP